MNLLTVIKTMVANGQTITPDESELIIDTSIQNQFKTGVLSSGEMNIRLTGETIRLAQVADEIRILSRLKTGLDLTRLALLVDAIEEYTKPECKLTLIVPYFPYCRTVNTDGVASANGLRTLTSLLDNMGFARIVTLDSPGDCGEYGIEDRLPRGCINEAIEHFAELTKSKSLSILVTDLIVNSKYSFPAVIGGVDVQTLQCSRGTNGQFFLPARSYFPPGKPVLIVDSLCDTGKTFINMRKEIPTDVRVGLYVTHGVFSQGTIELEKSFDKLYTTNSFQQIIGSEIHEISAAGEILTQLMLERRV